MSTDLDSRLRSAGTSLRASVEGLEPRPLPARGPARHPLVTAAAVALVVAAVVAAVAALRDDPATNVSTDPDEVPRLVLDESLVGLPATGAVDLPLDEAGTGFPPADVAVYEAPVEEGGVARIGVITYHLPDDDVASMEVEPGAEALTVRGVDGWFQQDELYGASLAWSPDPATFVTMASRHLDREQVLAAVEAGTGGDDGFAPGPVAPGLGTPEALGGPVQVDVATLHPAPAGAVGHGVAYQSDDDLQRVAFLSVVSAGDADVTALRWFTAADTPVEVRGHAGWMGTRTFPAGGAASDDDAVAPGGTGETGGTGGTEDRAMAELEAVESHTVMWEERPGVVAVLSASGFTADEVLRLASEGVDVASESEWAELLEAAGSPTPPDAAAAVGGSDGDVEWSVYLDDDGTVCAGTQTGSSGVETCGSAPGGAEVLTDDAGNELAVYGAFPEGAVDVRAPDGAPLGASTAPSEDGVVVYAIALDDGPPPAEVVFVDAEGDEVRRIQVGFAPAVEVESLAPSDP